MVDLLDALKQKIESGTPIEQFSEILFFAHDALLGVIGRMAEDREIDDSELDQLIEFFQAFTAACEYEKECRQAALEAAGGADAKGDLNRTAKVSAHLGGCNCQDCQFVNKLKV